MFDILKKVLVLYLSEFVCIFVTMRYHYTYSTSINMSKTIKVAFLLHLLPFDVAFSKTQTECMFDILKKVLVLLHIFFI
jgi:hypothetical protein